MNENKQIRSHCDLKVWQLGIKIAELVYQLTRTFPDDEKFGLVSQLRRAGISVPANIAEGNARESTKEYLRFSLSLLDHWQKLKHFSNSPRDSILVIHKQSLSSIH